MLDRLPLSLQQYLLLEWISPSAVYVVARAGSTSLRRAVLTTPRAFRAAEGEVLSDACVDWFRRRRHHEEEEDKEKNLELWTKAWKKGDYEFHTCNGKRHRDGDLPAAIWSNEWEIWLQKWYQNGELHRDNDKPAVVWWHGLQQWYQNGELHRENDLPAETSESGWKEWWIHGARVHRCRRETD